MSKKPLMASAVIVAIVTVVVGGPGAARAGPPDPSASHATVLPPPPPHSHGMKSVCPSQDGERLQDLPMPALVTVQLIDALGFPVYHYPPDKIRLVFISVGKGTAAYCPNYPHLALAASPTDFTGVTQIRDELIGGGWMTGRMGVEVNVGSFVSPDWQLITGGVNGGILSVLFNSPDIDGNGTIDLVDVGAFATDFSAGYHFRSDLKFDGVLNLADVAIMATHLGDGCLP